MPEGQISSDGGVGSYSGHKGSTATPRAMPADSLRASVSQLHEAQTAVGEMANRLVGPEPREAASIDRADEPGNLVAQIERMAREVNEMAQMILEDVSRVNGRI